VATCAVRSYLKSVLKGRGFSRAVQNRISVGALAPRETEPYTLGP